jgi:hypothetical protein
MSVTSIPLKTTKCRASLTHASVLQCITCWTALGTLVT